jgi:type IV pilus assembly protein PilY1
MKHPQFVKSSARPVRQAIAIGLIWALSLPAHAQFVIPGDISDAPLANTAAQPVKTNLMFIMDDSGSMGWDFMPDQIAGQNFGAISSACRGSARVNKIYFDPAQTYVPPVGPDGSAYPNATFTAARNDGFNSGSSTTDLSQVANLTTPSIQVGVNPGGSARFSRFYFATYKASATPITPQCLPGSGYDYRKWDFVTDTSTLNAAQRTNYANWFAYYRTRMLAMRTAVGYALRDIDAARFRVGYSAINSGSYTTGFLGLGDMGDAGHRATLYSRIYNTGNGGATPLRAALEKVGKYYAGKQMNGSALPSGVDDPVQYACQRNYALLTTDGYWNTQSESNVRSNYSPTQLDGSTAIGNQDGGTTKRPMLDDGRTSGSNWITGGAGVSNSLADIAMYFYKTDLRPTMEDLVPRGTRGDDAPHQHMTTFALGLGVGGELQYTPNYDSQGDFAAIAAGSRAWPNPRVDQSGENPARVDDLWHAAVNGRGRYHSASSTSELIASMRASFRQMDSFKGTASAASTSSLQPVSGDNFVFVGQYTTVQWTGNVRALTIEPTTGAVSTDALWEAKDMYFAEKNTTGEGTVDANSDTRRIFFHKPGATDGLAPFRYTDLNAAGHGAHFANVCAKPASAAPTQCTDGSLGGGDANVLNDGNEMVKYLRGQYRYEYDRNNSRQVFRNRATPLGDVVNANPVYVKRSPLRYSDPNFPAFVAQTETRAAMLYVAANDGMLHAYDATTGVEKWAFVPSHVMPNMYLLADKDYWSKHKYMVDGTPTVVDAQIGGAWKTVLVGGLNAGGRGYYALDITTPEFPKVLWELTPSSPGMSSMGLSYGNPVITQFEGEWVVIVSSGYKNSSPGDGRGRLYIRKLSDGSEVKTIDTGSGSVAAPLHLGKINTWIETDGINASTRSYGVDLRGNVWRFDLTAGTAVALANTGGRPITTMPVLAKIEPVAGGPSYNTVTVATGKLLGVSDLLDGTKEKVYVFKENASPLGNLSTNAGMVRQTLVQTGSKRSTATVEIDWTTKNGWYAEFLTAGERVNVEMLQSGPSLTVATNIPAVGDLCKPKGSSWLYSFELANGKTIDSSFNSNAMTAGLNYVILRGQLRVLVQDVQGDFRDERSDPPLRYGDKARRTSWRELIN